ncbi:Translation initiation factor eIF-2B subunit gamma, partial [Spiromyces aspiralis]
MFEAACPAGFQTPAEFTAVVLAGRGNSLFPLTEDSNLPKALLPVANRPMISYVINWLEAGGIKDILVVTCRKSEQPIAKYLREMHEGIANIEIVEIEESLGTAEVIRSIRDRIKNDFIVASCDSITDAPAQQFLDLYRLSRPSMAVLLSEEMDSEGGGGSSKDEELRYVVGIDQRSSQLVMLKPIDDDASDFDMRSSLIKKYPSLAISNKFLDVHIYVFSQWVIDFLNANPNITSLQEQLLPIMVRAQSQPQTYASYNFDQYINQKTDPCCDEGSSLNLSSLPGGNSDGIPLVKTNPLSVFAYTRRTCVGGRANTNPRYCDLNKGMAKLYGGAKVDPSALVGQKTLVAPDSLVGHGTRVGRSCRIEKSVVGLHCSIGDN